MFQSDYLFAIYSTVNIVKVSQVKFHGKSRDNLVDRLCTFSIRSIYHLPNISSRFGYNSPSAWGLRDILNKKLNNSTEKGRKDLFNKPRICIALAAAFWHCEDG